MPPFDANMLIADITADQPTGPNLEFDPDFGALDRAAQGKPEQQFGSTIIPAEEPDWKDVAAQATALLERSRDLRVLAHLAVARLHLEGLPAFAEVLAATAGLLAARWADVHPQLDPEDDNDPTLRANALLRVAHPGWVLRHLRTLPLARSARVGQFSWRDAAIATGTIEVEDGAEKPNETTIRAAFQDSDPARLGALNAAALKAAEAATAIGAAFDSNAGYGNGPAFDDLIKLLHDISHTILRYAVLDTDATPDAAEPETDTAVAATAAADPHLSAAPATAAPRRGVAAAWPTEITSREDALRLLDLVCRYYRRYEPSSPLPLLIERARRLAEKDFLEILRDLAPDGVGQAQAIIGDRGD
jgi:type VI secretion system protein ImpA